MKRCIQCGILKEQEDFRPYTYSKNKETSGRYRICRECEAINSRYKRSAPGDPDFVRITELYNMLESLGYRTPRITAFPDRDESIDKIILHYKQAVQQPGKPIETVNIYAEGEVYVTVPALIVPEELQQWLDANPAEWLEQDISPEFLQETIYESLKAKYRPQVGIDRDKFVPIYDDTYKEVLNNILRKFDDYEEEFANAERSE